MRTSLDELHLFCRIVESQSLRAVADEIGLAPSNVSRRLAALEERLRVRLVTRSRTRSTATDAGRQYYRSVKTLLEQLASVDEDISGVACEPRGLLRLAAPTVFGARYVAPWLHELQLRAPTLDIDLVLSDSALDLVEHGIDVALRVDKLADSSLIAIKLGTVDTTIVAAPSYLARAGAPATPEELAHHAYVKHEGVQQDEIALESATHGTISVQCRSRFTSSSILGVLHAVMAGAGFNVGPSWLFAEALDRGELVPLLPQWHPVPGALHALVLPGPYRPAKVTAVLDLLRSRMPAVDGIR